MQLGGPLHEEYLDPESWIDAVDASGYSATYCPIDTDASTDEIRVFREAAAAADVTIAEVHGFGFNPLARDESERRAALSALKDRLALADEIGARCVVNIAGSRNPDQWDGPHPENLTEETFDRIVASVQEIIDDVNPSTAAYTLETMPWMYPDSVESYARLVAAIDREQFGVHFDPVNLVCSPRRYYANDELIEAFIDTLGPHVRSVHLKDIQLREGLTTHLDEVRPGAGNLDYEVLLGSLDGLDRDVPLLLEHLETPDEYRQAAEHVRAVAADVGVTV